MTPEKAAPKRGRPRSQGSAAKAETKRRRNGKAPTVTCLERSYTLPATMPETVLFDIVEIEAAQESNDPMPLMRFLRGMLGEDQFRAMKTDLTGKSGEAVGKAIADMVADIFGAYGVTPGE